ncbi:MAG: hypothetical protein PUE66_01410 [Erysipelotrichaceae bacterium]|nr:hypothetical protein [Erysipelotrichaceae bacterium]
MKNFGLNLDSGLLIMKTAEKCQIVSYGRYLVSISCQDLIEKMDEMENKK